MPPIISPAYPPRSPRIKLPATGTIDPAAAPTAPRRPAPIALNAALPGFSPSATDNPKSIKAPITDKGILFKNGLTLESKAFFPAELVVTLGPVPGNLN